MSIVRIVGAPATGKSVLRSIIADALAIPAYGIDDERLAYGWGDRAWASLASKVAAAPSCILETSGHSPNDRTICLGHATYTILCTASTAVRRQRLQERQSPEHDYVQRLLALGSPCVKPQAVLNSDGDQFPADRLASAIERAKRFIELRTG